MPSRRPPGWSFSLIVASIVALLVSPASARQIDDAAPDADVAIAEQKAAQAFEAYQDKRFTEAVALYLEAYRAAPSADLLYNVARIYDAKLADRPLAITFYRRYIADPGAVADRIQIANERLVALRDAELAVARPAPEPAPMAPARVDSADARADAAVRRQPEPAWQAAEVTGVIMGASGIVALGVGAGYGIAAMSDRDTVRELCPGNVCSEQRGIDAAASAADHATVSTIAFVSGGALLALGAVVYFWLGNEPSGSEGAAASQPFQLALNPRRGGAALELGGTW